MLPALLGTVLLMAVAYIVYYFGQLPGGLLILIVGGAIIWTVGILLQAAFVLGYIPPAFVAVFVVIMTSETTPRMWHTH